MAMLPATPLKQLPIANHHFTQLSPHVYALSADSSTDRPILGVVVGSRATLLIDAGNSPAHAQVLKQALDESGLPQPDFVVLTHWHWDHVFGTAAFPVPTFAHSDTCRIVQTLTTLDWSDAALDARVAEGTEIAFCRDMMKLELPDRSTLTLRVPEVGFTDRLELDLGGITCDLIHVGGDHSRDSVVVHVREEGVVFLSDSIYPDIYSPARRYTESIFEMLERLLALNAEFYLAGHDDKPMTRAGMLEEATLLRTVGKAVIAHKGEREAALAALEQHYGTLTDDHRELTDYFMAGLEPSS